MMHSEEIIDSLLDQVAQLKAERDALLAQRQPLTDEEINHITDKQWGLRGAAPNYAAFRAYARALEKAHGIGDNK